MTSIFSRCLGLSLWVTAALTSVTALAAPPVAPVRVTLAQTLVSQTSSANPAVVDVIVRWQDRSADENIFLIEFSLNGTVQTSVTQRLLANETEKRVRLSSGLKTNDKLVARVYACKANISYRDDVLYANITERSVAVASNTINIALSSSETAAAMEAADDFEVVTRDAGGASVAERNALSDGEVKFEWKDQSKIEERYRIRIISNTPNNPPPTSGTDTRFDSNTLPTTEELFGNGNMEHVWSYSNLQTRLEPAQSYRAQLRPYKAVNPATNPPSITLGPPSEVIFTSPALLQPAAVFNGRTCRATAVGEASVRVDWTDSSNNEGRYLIYAAVNGSTTYNLVSIAARNESTITLSPAFAGQSVIFRVVADFALSGAAPASPAVGAIATDSVAVDVPELIAPTRLYRQVNDSVQASNTIVDLYWFDNSSAEEGYEVLGLTTGDIGYRSIATVGTNVTSIRLNSELLQGRDYSLKVRAFSGGSTSADSNIVEVVTRNGITSSAVIDITKGTPLSYTLTGSSAFASVSATGLPSGMDLTTPAGVLSISNQATLVPGVYPVVFEATFADGWVDRMSTTLRVKEAVAAPLTVGPTTLTTAFIAGGNDSNPEITLPISAFFTDVDTKAAVRVQTNLPVTPGTSSPTKSYDIILYPDLTPQSVQNMVDRLVDYTNTVVHRAPRSADGPDPDPTFEGFVVQAGFFKPSTITAGLYDILPALTSPQNEPGISNLTGTVAWAKRAGDPNSATHDFFVNTEDNLFLNDDNGGFTVFGRVPTAGMAVINQIQNLVTTLPDDPNRSIYNVPLRSPETNQVSNTSLSDWPLVGPALTPGQLPGAANLIQYTSVTLLNSKQRLNLTANSDNNNVAKVDVVDEQIIINAVGNGTAVLTFSATDLDGNSQTHTLNVTVDSMFSKATIATQPINEVVEAGETATFSVVLLAGSTGPVSYQWQKDGFDIDSVDNPSAITNTLTLTNVQHSDAGKYRVVITDPSGAIISQEPTLSLSGPAVILAQPADTEVSYGQPVTLTVRAGGPNLSYQWYKGNEKLLNGGSISGVTTAMLQISAAGLNDAGMYKVTVTNPITTAPLMSNAAELTVIDIDTDRDGLSDREELEKGLNPNAVDTDGDGYNDGVEEDISPGSAKSASKKPSSTHYVASEEMTKTLNGIAFEPITTATGETRWLSAKEITQAEFAAVLQWAVSVMNIAEFKEMPAPDQRTAIVMKEDETVVCYLAQSTDNATAPNSDIQSSGAGNTFFLPNGKAKLPMNRVSFYGAELAATVLNDFHFNTNYDLPTSGDWETAARGGSSPGSTYPTGSTVSKTLANFNTPTGAPKNVGNYKPNILGMYDLAGNVAEWTRSLSGGNRMIRGGSFKDGESIVNNGSLPQEKPAATISVELGIRLALNSTSITPPVVDPPAGRKEYALQSTDNALFLNVLATGAPPLVYQWYRDGVALKSQTSAGLLIPRPKLTDAGKYHATVATRGGTAVKSADFLIGVVEQKNPVQTLIVANRKSASFTANAIAPAGYKLKYRWASTAASFGDGEDIWFRKGTKTKTFSIFPTYNGNSTIVGRRGPGVSYSDLDELDDTGVYACFIDMLDASNVPVAPTIFTRFQLIVPQLPEIPNAYDDVDTVVGGSNVFQLTSNGNTLVTRWEIKNLPPGMTYDPATGIVRGRPTQAGTYILTIRASNAQGNSSESTLEITVDELEEKTVGEFVALLNRSVRPGLGDSLGGKVELTVSKSSAFTGKITFGAKAYKFKGALNQTIGTTGLDNPTGYVEIPRKGTTTLRLGFSIDKNTGALEGVTDEIYTGGGVALGYSAVKGWRNEFNNEDLALAFRAGIHGFALDSTDSSVPAGHSYGRAIVPKKSAKHRVAVSGKMADGAAFTCSHPMSAAGQFLLYTSLYKNQGSVHGILKQSAGTVSTPSVINAEDPVTWLKKTVGSVAGFGGVSGVEMSVTGAVYQERTPGTIPLGYTSGTLNGKITFDDDLLVTPITQIFTVGNAAKNFLSVSANSSDPKIGTVKLSLDLKKGTFSGSFKYQPVAAGALFTVKYAGVLLRDTTSGAGATEHIGLGSYSYKDSSGDLQTGFVNIGKN